MKALLILLLLFVSCQNKSNQNEAEQLETNKTIAIPTEAMVKTLIENKFTEQNGLDGTENVNIKSLIIENINYNAIDSSCLIEYNICCSFTPAVRSPDNMQEAPDSINTSATVQLMFINNKWIINQTIDIFNP